MLFQASDPRRTGPYFQQSRDLGRDHADPAAPPRPQSPASASASGRGDGDRRNRRDAHVSAEPVEIVLDTDSAMAWIGAESWLLPPPSRFWHALAERFGDRFVHVLPKGPCRGARRCSVPVSAAARRRAEAVRRAPCSLQVAAARPYLSRPQMLAVLPLAPGALLCRADAAARAAADLSDAWTRTGRATWLLALARRGPGGAVRSSLAGPGDEAPTASRLPPDRARLGPHSRGRRFHPRLLVGSVPRLASLDGLPMAERARIRMLEPGDLFSDLHWLAAASLVIVVRGFEFAERNGALDLLLELGTPVLSFTDDDFIVLGATSASLGTIGPRQSGALPRDLSASSPRPRRLPGRLRTIIAT